MPTLRAEQLDFVNNILSAFKTNRAVMGVYPTGGGKTFCFSYITSKQNGQTLITAHRKKIIIQISKSLALFEVKHRIIAPSHIVREARRQHLRAYAKSFIDQNAKAAVGSVQTLTSKTSEKNPKLKAWISGVQLAVFDEGHHYTNSGQWAKVVNILSPSAKILFVTATPERCDGKGLGAHSGGFAQKMIEGPPVKWQIEQGRLSRYRYICPESDFNVNDVPLTASGEFNSQAFRSKVVESHLVGDLVIHYVKHIKGLKTIVFATDTETAAEMEEAFKGAGFRAKALSYKTPVSEAERALEAYESGNLDLLINVDLFDEGFDVPDTEAVIMARPTMSLGKFLQQIGRALRTAKGKEFAYILDCVRNWERHGLPDWPRVWTLDAREKGTRRKSDTLDLKICTNCTQPFETFKRICPHCGYAEVPTERKKPEQVGGDLYELDTQALNQIFERVRLKNLTTQEYQKDLIRRGCPGAAIPKNIKTYNEAKHIREALKNLMDWWVGAQPGREMSEIYRRFYTRFNIDMLSALALNKAQTQELISRIAQRFTEDIIL